MDVLVKSVHGSIVRTISSTVCVRVACTCSSTSSTINGCSSSLTARINNIAHVKNTGAVNRKRNVHNYFKDYCAGQKKNMRQIF